MSRGGARHGAGRKRIDDDVRATLSMRVLPTTKEKLACRAKECGLSIGLYIDRLMSE